MAQHAWFVLILLGAAALSGGDSMTGVRSEAGGSGTTERKNEGSTRPAQNTIEGVSDVHGSIQSIRGIEGIDTVPLQNLETVLRMQSRVTEQRPRGTARTAAGLATMDPQPDQPPPDKPDGRTEHLELPMEGS